MVELANKQEWKMKGIELGYILGYSLIIAAIIYFFASNWPGFGKWTKIGLSIGLILLFYAFSFLIRLIVNRHPFLGQLFLFFGCLSFGVGVALLGQIYNSHADSYMLFLVWAIPALLFSYVTRFQAFYVLSFIVIHLAIYFFLFPSSSFHHVPEAVTEWIFLGVAVMNGVLFFITDQDVIKSRVLKFLSFVVMHVILLGLTIEDFFDPFNIFISLLYVAVFVYLYRYFIKNDLHKSFFVLLSLSGIAFVIIKFIEFVVFMDTEYIFLFTFILPFIIVGFVIYSLRKWKVKRGGEVKGFTKKIIVGMTTLIASIIAGSSIFGMAFLFIGDIPFAFFAFLAIALILLAKIKQNWDTIITYTLVFTALFIGIPASIESNLAIDFLFMAALVYVFWTFTSRTIRYITYLSLMVVVTATLFEGTTDHFYNAKEIVFSIVFLFNVVAYFISTRLAQSSGQLVVMNNSMFYGLLTFFILTFFFEDQAFLYYLMNGLYFVVTTSLVVYALRRNYTIRYWLFIAFWFAYVVYKYYDLVWSLLHKSVTFFITGLFILLLVQRFDRLLEKQALENRVEAKLAIAKKVFIVMIIIVQLGLLGVQIGKSESLLANGELIKLELAPVDPRSLLQGDYLTLRYTISTLELEDGGWNERVKIGLTENEHGVYEYSGYYTLEKEIPDEFAGKADVWITGNFRGYQNIEYGIENYFVPEGTGWDLQEKVNYAYVKVAANGDAMLVDLSEE